MHCDGIISEMHAHYTLDVVCMMPASSSQEQTPEIGSLTVIWIRTQKAMQVAQVAIQLI